MNDLVYCQNCLCYSAVMNAALCFARQINIVNNITMIRLLLFTEKHLALVSLGIHLEYLYFHSCKIQVAWAVVE